MPRSKFAKDAHTRHETFEAHAILDEKGNRFKVAWKGIDPATNAPYEPTWEPKRYANASLKHEWAAKKAEERLKLKQTATTNSHDSVSVTDHTRLNPSIENPIANTSTTEQLLAAPLPTNTPAVESQSSGNPITTRTAREKLAKARSAKATTTSHAATQALPTAKPATKAPASTSNGSPAIGTPAPKPSITNCQHEQKHTKKRTDSAQEGHTDHSGTQRPNGEGSAPSRTGAPSTSSHPSAPGPASSSSSLPSSSISQSASQTPSASTSSSSSSTTTTPSSSSSFPSPKKRKRKSPGWTKNHKPSHHRHHAQVPTYDVYYAAVGIVDERPDRYLVAWAPDPLTGAAFADTWEPKDYVMPLMVKEWEQRKMRIAVENAEEELRGAAGRAD